MIFGVFDTEDDSPVLMKAGRSGFEKTVTQIAAVTSIDESFTPGPRFHNRGARKPFINYMLRMAERHGVTRWYAHNLQYDLGNLFADQLDELDMVMVGGRLIRAKWQNLVFLDSFNLFPTSVKKLGEALGLEKMEMDIHSKEYVFRDCEIIALALEKLTETVREYGLERPTNTLGGLCVALWQAMGGTNPHDATAFSRSAIYGGRVEIFQPGGAGNIAWTDINSLYPSVMLNESPGEMKPCRRMKKFGITRCTVWIPKQRLAPLPYRVTVTDKLTGVDEQAIIFPCGRLTGTWVNAELREAVEHHGVVIEQIHESAGTDEGVRPYAHFVETFYEKRLASESEAYKLIYKLLMNNLYGQLGMGGTVTKTVAATTELVDAVKHGRREATLFGDGVMFNVAIPLPDHVNYAHAAHVTAYGRIALLRHLRQVPPADLIYCDTDSCFFFQKEGTPLPFATGSKLGEMKIEAMGEKIECIAPKTYKIVLADAYWVFKDDKLLGADEKWGSKKVGMWSRGQADNMRRKHGGEVRKVKYDKAKGVPSKHAEVFLRDRVASYEAPFKMKEAINFFDRANVSWEQAPDGRMIPVLGEKRRGNARRLSVWRVVKKQLLSEYRKKTKKKDGSFWPLCFGVKTIPKKKVRKNKK